MDPIGEGVSQYMIVPYRPGASPRQDAESVTLFPSPTSEADMEDRASFRSISRAPSVDICRVACQIKSCGKIHMRQPSKSETQKFKHKKTFINMVTDHSGSES